MKYWLTKLRLISVATESSSECKICKKDPFLWVNGLCEKGSSSIPVCRTFALSSKIWKSDKKISLLIQLSFSKFYLPKREMGKKHFADETEKGGRGNYARNKYIIELGRSLKIILSTRKCFSFLESWLALFVLLPAILCNPLLSLTIIVRLRIHAKIWWNVYITYL